MYPQAPGPIPNLAPKTQTFPQKLSPSALKPKGAATKKNNAHHGPRDVGVLWEYVQAYPGAANHGLGATAGMTGLGFSSIPHIVIAPQHGASRALTYLQESLVVHFRG